MLTNPQEIQTSNRRKKLQKVYASEEWERACDEVLHRGHIKIKGIIRGEGLQCGEAGMLVHESWELLQAKLPCEWHKKICGIEVKVGTLVHHAYIESYKNGTYVDLKTIDKDILCGKCHYAIHASPGLDLCRCGKYMLRGATMCKECFDKAHPEIKAEKELKAAKKKAEDKAFKDRIKADKKAEKERYKIDHPKRKARSQSHDQEPRQLMLQ